MRKLLVSGLLAAVLAAPSSAHAVVFLGARLGYAMPSGDVQKSDPIKDTIDHHLPIQVDAGMSLLPFVGLGVYGSYAPTTLASKAKDNCASGGASCSASQLRGGLQLNLRLPVLDALWAGVFGGFEQVSVKAAGNTGKVTGWEAGLQAGYDLSPLPLLKIGPFVSYGFGTFTSASGKDPGGDDMKLGDKAQHSALTIGLRGLFDL